MTRSVRGRAGCGPSAVVAQLAVVIVLEDPRSGAPRPLDERGPSLRRQRHAERHLVRRGDEHPGEALVRGELIDVDAAAVDGHGHEFEAAGDQRRAVQAEARIFDGDAPAALREERRESPQCVGDAARDDHLLRASDRRRASVRAARRAPHAMRRGPRGRARRGRPHRWPAAPRAPPRPRPGGRGCRSAYWQGADPA